MTKIWLVRESRMLSLACRDVGIMDCEYVSSGETEEELWKNGTAHIIKVYGTEDADITPQFKESYKRYIKYS